VQYLLLIYGEERPTGPGESMDEMQPWIGYTQWLVDQGWMRAGEGLLPTSEATTVRIVNEERVVTDGPFAETKEALGGFYLIEVDHLDDAIEAAARCPGGRYGSIEVRPIAPTPLPREGGDGS
jgi:hypothetical protein